MSYCMNAATTEHTANSVYARVTIRLVLRIASEDRDTIYTACARSPRYVLGRAAELKRYSGSAAAQLDQL